MTENISTNKTPSWPFELFGVECGSGWAELYTPIFKYIEEYNKDKNEDDKIYPLQVKEKWGRLEFYTNFINNELEEMIENAYEESAKVCEKCGSREDVGTVLSGYMYTTCKKCLMEELKNCSKTVLWFREDDKTRYWVSPNGEMSPTEENLP